MGYVRQTWPPALPALPATKLLHHFISLLRPSLPLFLPQPYSFLHSRPRCIEVFKTTRFRSTENNEDPEVPGKASCRWRSGERWTLFSVQGTFGDGRHTRGRGGEEEDGADPWRAEVGTRREDHLIRQPSLSPWIHLYLARDEKEKITLSIFNQFTFFLFFFYSLNIEWEPISVRMPLTCLRCGLITVEKEEDISIDCYLILKEYQ